MTEHTYTDGTSYSGSSRRTRHDPWWIPLGEAISAVLAALPDRPGAGAADLPPEVLRDHDPALHRAMNDRIAARDLDVGSRALFY